MENSESHANIQIWWSKQLSTNFSPSSNLQSNGTSSSITACSIYNQTQSFMDSSVRISEEAFYRNCCCILCKSWANRWWLDLSLLILKKRSPLLTTSTYSINKNIMELAGKAWNGLKTIPLPDFRGSNTIKIYHLILQLVMVSSRIHTGPNIFLWFTLVIFHNVYWNHQYSCMPTIKSFISLTLV